MRQSIHTHRPKPAPAPPPEPAPAPPVNPRAARLKRWGAVAATTWYLGGFALLVAAMVAQAGPVGAMSGWLSRTLGYDNSMLAFLPFFAVLALPVFVLQLTRRSPHPFVRGAQDAFQPPRAIGIVGPTTLARRTGIGARISFGVTVVSAAAGITGFLLVNRPPANAGRPLPALSVDQVIARRASLPGHVRLTRASTADRPVWVREWTSRTTSYAEIYFPIDRWGGPDNPVQLLGLRSSPISGEVYRPDLSLALPLDGTLSLVSIPAWQRERMLEQGFTVADPVILLTEDKTLHGRYPGADTMTAISVLVFGLMFAALSGIIGGIFLWQRRAALRALRDEAIFTAHDQAVRKLHRDAGL